MNSYVCYECGRSIPELNRTIHSARCKSASSKELNGGNLNKSPEKNSYAEDEIVNKIALATASDLAPSLSISNNVGLEHSPSSSSFASGPAASSTVDFWCCEVCTMHNDLQVMFCQACGNQKNRGSSVPDRVHLDDWQCEHCTYINTSSNATCDICSNQRLRPADATVRERLVSENSEPHWRDSSSENELDNANHMNSFDAALRGAMIGGVLGGLATLLAGNSQRSAIAGAVQGAAMGAIGSSMLSDAMGHMVMTSTHNVNGRSITTTTRRRMRPSSSNPPSAGAPTQDVLRFEDMLRLVFSQRQADGQMFMDTDNMTHEQLLDLFGFGNNMRGADEERIQLLPSERLKDDSADAEGQLNPCSICLEPLLKDQQCTRLHCNHIYHTPCISEWLRNVSNCPVCKHNV